MDDLLTPVSKTYLKPRQDDEPFLTEVKPTKLVQPVDKTLDISSADEALDILRNQPDYESLISVLKFLRPNRRVQTAFSLQTPSPKSAAIVQSLVTEIAPNYWALLYEGSGDDTEKDNDHHHLDLFVSCLRSVTGINAIVSHLKSLLQESKSGNRELKRPDVQLHLSVFLGLLATILKGANSIRTLWETSISDLATESLKKAQSQALRSILTSGKLVSVAAEASDIIGRDQLRTETQWIIEGSEVTKWIGLNITSWVKTHPPQDQLHFCSDLFHRALSLGYSGMFLQCHSSSITLTLTREPH